MSLSIALGTVTPSSHVSLPPQIEARDGRSSTIVFWQAFSDSPMVIFLPPVSAG
jgi:hypothetical protein